MMFDCKFFKFDGIAVGLLTVPIKFKRIYLLIHILRSSQVIISKKSPSLYKRCSTFVQMMFDCKFFKFDGIAVGLLTVPITFKRIYLLIHILRSSQLIISEKGPSLYKCCSSFVQMMFDCKFFKFDGIAVGLMTVPITFKRIYLLIHILRSSQVIISEKSPSLYKGCSTFVQMMFDCKFFKFEGIAVGLLPVPTTFKRIYLLIHILRSSQVIISEKSPSLYK